MDAALASFKPTESQHTKLVHTMLIPTEFFSQLNNRGKPFY